MAYELKTNTVVDALNEIYLALAGDEAGKEGDTVVEALNNISTVLGGGVYMSAPDAIRDIGGKLVELYEASEEDEEEDPQEPIV